MGTLVLFLILEEMLAFNFFAIEDNVCCAFVVYGFYYVEICSSDLLMFPLEVIAL